MYAASKPNQLHQIIIDGYGVYHSHHACNTSFILLSICEHIDKTFIITEDGLPEMH